MGVKENLKAAKDMEKAWNVGDLKKVWATHSKMVIASGPHLPSPTKGIEAHRKDVEGLIAAFPDMKVSVTFAFGKGEWLVEEGVYEGTHKGPLVGPGGLTLPPTNKRIRLPFCELTRWENGKIAEERSYFDLAGMMMQLGIVPSP